MSSCTIRRSGRLLPALLLVIMLSAQSDSAYAQSNETTTTASADTVVAADPADVESIDSITAALYESISGGIGVPRQWDRFRSLFIADARLIPVQVTPNGNVYRAWTPEEYISRAGPFLLKNGFFETETNRKTERYGSIAHYFSTYDSRRLAEDPEPYQRGINSIQLMHDGSRWWIVTVFWQGETPGVPIPDEYLSSK